MAVTHDSPPLPPQPPTDPSCAPEPQAIPNESAPHTDIAPNLVAKLVVIFQVACASSIFLWLMAGAGFPWFIYVIYAAAFIDCVIYGVKQRNLFFVNWTIYSITNLMLFLTFLACGGGYPWFIYPAFSMAILPVSQYIWKTYESPIRWLYVHAAIYTLINSMLFFTWMVESINNPYPWFVYPICGWGVALLIQYNYIVMHNKAKLFLFIAVDISAMLAITFRFVIGPAFFIILLVGFVVAAIYYTLVKKGYMVQFSCMKKAPTSAQDPSQPDPQVQVSINPEAPVYNQVYNQVPNQINNNNVQYPQQPLPQGYQNMYYQPTPGTGPVYYAYFPSRNSPLYPTIGVAPPAPMYPPPQMPMDQQSTSPVPFPSPSPLNINNNNYNNNNAIIAESQQEKDNGKEEEEEGHLLNKSSPPRSYSPQ